jgi:hypothetical protein
MHVIKAFRKLAANVTALGLNEHGFRRQERTAGWDGIVESGGKTRGAWFTFQDMRFLAKSFHCRNGLRLLL